MSDYQAIMDIKGKVKEEIKKKSIDCKPGFERHPEVYAHSEYPDPTHYYERLSTCPYLIENQVRFFLPNGLTFYYNHKGCEFNPNRIFCYNHS